MLFSLAFLGGLAWGVGTSTVRDFERAAANDIRAKLRGPQMEVSVKTKLNGVIGGALGDMKRVTIRAEHFATDGLPLFTEPDRSQKGLVRDLRLELVDFELAGLRVERLSASIPNCRFDYALALSKRQIRLSKSGVGVGTVVLRDKDLEAFILRKFKEIKRVTVRIEDGRAVVEGYGEFLVISTNFSVTAKLTSPDGRTLELTDPTILFDGRPADKAASRVILDTLNPVVDLPKDLGLYDAVQVKGVRLKPGFLEAWGDTKIPVRPQDKR